MSQPVAYWEDVLTVLENHFNDDLARCILKTYFSVITTFWLHLWFQNSQLKNWTSELSNSAIKNQVSAILLGQVSDLWFWTFWTFWNLGILYNFGHFGGGGSRPSAYPAPTQLARYARGLRPTPPPTQLARFVPLGRPWSLLPGARQQGRGFTGVLQYHINFFVNCSDLYWNYKNIHFLDFL